MEPINILIADDIDYSHSQLLIENSSVKDRCQVFATNFARELYNCPPEVKTAVDIINGLDHLEIALIDLVWEREFPRRSEGGNFIIELIQTRFPYCLIIPITKEMGDGLEDPTHKTKNGHFLPAIPKFSTANQEMIKVRVKEFNVMIVNWIFNLIKSINDGGELLKIQKIICGEISNDKISGDTITLGNKQWPLSWLLIDKFLKPNDTLFNRDSLVDKIQKSIDSQTGPKVGHWNKENPLSKKFWVFYNNNGGGDYFSGISDFEIKFQLWYGYIIALGLGKKTDFSEWMKKACNKLDIKIPHNQKWEAINDPWSIKGKKYFYHKLIWRRIILRIYNDYEDQKLNQEFTKVLAMLRDLRMISYIHKEQLLYLGDINDIDPEDMTKKYPTFFITQNLGLRMDNNNLEFPDADELFNAEKEFLNRSLSNHAYEKMSTLGL